MTEQEQQEAFYASLIVGLTPLAESTSTEAYVTELFQAVLGRDPSATGLANVSAAIDGGTFNMDDFITTALTADLSGPEFDYLTAEESAAAQASQDALVAEQAAFNAANPVTPDEPVEEPGDTIWLTNSTDRGGIFDGTANADQFNAYLEQNQYTGGVSNSLSSADVLDGGAGTDSLYAELVQEFIGFDADDSPDIQARTSNIEIVEFEAREGNDSTITVDAKHMTDIDSIGSLQSDSDLVIENLTTLTSSGAVRNTEDITITMDHTDNFNSDEDASDLTVYFDEDYLIAGQSTTASQANYWLLDEDSLNYNTAPLENIERDGVTLTIDGSPVIIVMDSVTAAAADTWDAFAAGLQAVIDAEVAGGNTLLEDLSVVVDWDNTDETYNDAGILVQIPAITIIDAQGRDIEPTGFISPADATGAFDIYGRFDNEESTQTNNPVTVNVDLHKVGREGEGGDLLIGGKELDSDGGEEDQGNGITVFNIDVLGAANKLSNLGSINSTNNALTTVNIATHADYIAGDSFASLTIRDAFATYVGWPVDAYVAAAGMETVNANAFYGDLDIGEDTSALNVDTFTATGGGDVTYYAEIDGDEKGVFTNTTGAGDDFIYVDLDGDAVDQTGTSFSVNAGNGNNEVYVEMTTGNVSVATTALLDNLDIITGSGEDFIYLAGGTNGAIDIASGLWVSDSTDGDSDFNIIAGSNTDTVVIDGGNGSTGMWDISTATGPATFVDRVLYHATLTVDFAGFSQTVSIATNSTGDFIATQADINDAIKDAIDSNSELARLLNYADGTGVQQLNITSNAKGENDLTISVFQPELVAAATVTPTATQVKLIAADHADMQDGFIATTLLDSDGTDSEADLIAAMNVTAGSLNLNETGAAVGADFLLDSANIADGTNNTSATNVSTIDMGAGANDLVVLDSNEYSANTLLFSATWDKVSVVNFFTSQHNDVTGTAADVANSTTITHTDDLVGLHIIDFTNWLDDLTDPSSATVGDIQSAFRTATTHTVVAAGDLDLDSNEVVILNQWSQATGETWAGMTANDVDAAISGTQDYGTNAIIASGANANALNVGATQDSILMVENDLNQGEYKVFNIETTDAGLVTEAFDVTLIGTIDFGESIDTANGLADTNFA